MVMCSDVIIVVQQVSWLVRTRRWLFVRQSCHGLRHVRTRWVRDCPVAEDALRAERCARASSFDSAREFPWLVCECSEAKVPKARWNYDLPFFLVCVQGSALNQPAKRDGHCIGGCGQRRLLSLVLGYCCTTVWQDGESRWWAACKVAVG